MSQNRTDKSNYPSKYSPGGWITASQYIVEVLCEIKARAEGKDLPIHFYELDEWGKFYRQQIPTAHQLLKYYSANAIVRVLKAPRNKNTYSLRAPWLVEQFKTEQAKLERENIGAGEKLINVLEANTIVKGRPKRGMGAIDKLRLDDNDR